MFRIVEQSFERNRTRLCARVFAFVAAQRSRFSEHRYSVYVRRLMMAPRADCDAPLACFGVGRVQVRNPRFVGRIWRCTPNSASASGATDEDHPWLVVWCASVAVGFLIARRCGLPKRSHAGDGATQSGSGESWFIIDLPRSECFSCELS